jgi:branched-chain amino acid transport system substrate-binding protein
MKPSSRVFEKSGRVPVAGIFVAVLLCVFLLAGCRKPATVAAGPEPGAPSAINPVDIGVLLPLKGEAQSSGDAVLNGMVFAAEESNKAGGVLGRPIRLIVRDTRSEPDRAVRAARDLVEQDKAVALVGGISAGSAESAKVADELAIPMLALGSTMPGIPSREPWIFRICYADAFSGRVMAKFAESLNASRALVLYDSGSDYAKALSLAFGRQFKNRKGAGIALETYTPDLGGLDATLAEIKRKSPDLVYLPASAGEAGEILKRARQAGITVPFLGTASWDSPQFLEIAGEAANGCYLPGRFVPGGADAVGKTFEENYSLRHGKPAPGLAAMGFDAVVLLRNAIQRAGGTDASSLRKALAETMGFPGLTGEITIDPEMAVTKAVPVLKCEGGKLVFLEEIRP